MRVARTGTRGGDVGGGTVDASAFSLLGDLKPLDRAPGCNLSSLILWGGHVAESLR